MLAMLVKLCVHEQVGGWGKGRRHYYPSSVSHLISATIIWGSVNAAGLTLISHTQQLSCSISGGSQGNHRISAMTYVDWAGQSNDKPPSVSGEEVLTKAG